MNGPFHHSHRLGTVTGANPKLSPPGSIQILTSKHAAADRLPDVVFEGPVERGSRRSLPVIQMLIAVIADFAPTDAIEPKGQEAIVWRLASASWCWRWNGLFIGHTPSKTLPVPIYAHVKQNLFRLQVVTPEQERENNVAKSQRR